MALFGTWLDNKLNEQKKDGTYRYTLSELLSDPEMGPGRRKQGSVSQLIALMGDSIQVQPRVEAQDGDR